MPDVFEFIENESYGWKDIKYYEEENENKIDEKIYINNNLK